VVRKFVACVIRRININNIKLFVIFCKKSQIFNVIADYGGGVCERNVVGLLICCIFVVEKNV